MDINKDLNENEVTILRSLVDQMFAGTGGEFGFLEEVDRGKFSKHEFAGYISALQKKGAFDYLDKTTGDYKGQYAIHEYVINQFVR